MHNSRIYDPKTVVPSGVTLTVQDVITGLEAAVADKGPDWVDPQAGAPGGCRYSTYEEDAGMKVPVAPACIAGQVLHQHGVTIGDADDYGMIAMIHERILLTSGFVIESEAVRVLQRAQSEQDQGNSWGNAVESAKSFAERIAPTEVSA